MRMDWLSPNGAMIDFEQQLVHIRTPSRGELVIQRKGIHHGPVICSQTRARHYLQQGCFIFVVYVIDSWEIGKATMDDVRIVPEYPNVFLEDLLGVPPKRQVEFRIDLVLGADPIAKAPYRLALPKMHEFSTQLQERLDKRFIRLSRSP